MKTQQEIVAHNVKDPIVQKLISSQQAEISELRGTIEIKERRISELENENRKLQAKILSLTDQLNGSEDKGNSVHKKGKRGRPSGSKISGSPTKSDSASDLLGIPEHTLKRKKIEPISSNQNLSNPFGLDQDADTLTTLIKIMEQDTKENPKESKRDHTPDDKKKRTIENKQISDHNTDFLLLFTFHKNKNRF